MFLFLLGHYLSERTFSLNASPGCELPHDGEMDPGSLQQHLIQLLTPSRELRSEFVKTQSVITILASSPCALPSRAFSTKSQIRDPYITRCMAPGQCYILDLHARCSSPRKRGIALGR